MNILIRDAKREDSAAAFSLIEQLAEYEKASNEVTNTLDQFTEDGFGEEPKYFLKVASDEENNILGIALYYPMYSTWKGKLMYLDDLVIDRTHRRKGIGKLLLDSVIRDSIEKGSHQFRFHVLDWNQPAINFYKTYPFTFEDEWVTVKLDKKNYSNL